MDDETLRRVMKKLPLEDLNNATLVCRHWKEISRKQIRRKRVEVTSWVSEHLQRRLLADVYPKIDLLVVYKPMGDRIAYELLYSKLVNSHPRKLRVIIGLERHSEEHFVETVCVASLADCRPDGSPATTELVRSFADRIGMRLSLDDRFGGARCLTAIDVGHCDKVTDETIAAICTLVGDTLERLAFGSTSAGADALIRALYLPKLRELRASGLDLSSPTPTTLPPLKNCVQKLDVGRSTLGEAVIESISRCTELVALRASGDDSTPQFVAALGKLTRLSFLDLDWSYARGQEWQQLALQAPYSLVGFKITGRLPGVRQTAMENAEEMLWHLVLLRPKLATVVFEMFPVLACFPTDSQVHRMKRVVESLVSAREVGLTVYVWDPCKAVDEYWRISQDGKEFAAVVSRCSMPATWYF